MKALITTAVLSVAVLTSTQALAGHRFGYVRTALPISVPTATCVTHATHAPLPQYVCCKMRDAHGHLLWKKTWVSGGCGMVGATVDFRCGIKSPVFGTGAPINASCQFSHSTGMYKQYKHFKKYYNTYNGPGIHNGYYDGRYMSSYYYPDGYYPYYR